jgi:hypothetical protein
MSVEFAAAGRRGLPDWPKSMFVGPARGVARLLQAVRTRVRSPIRRPIERLHRRAGMTMDQRHKTVVSAGLLALAGLPLVSALAESSTRSRITVTAQVAATARIEQTVRAVVVEITTDDRAKGLVTSRVTLTVRSNDTAGYTLTVWPRADWFGSVRVDGLGTSAELPADGGAIVRRTGGALTEDVVLDLTFRLRDGIPVGTYAWPVEFEVSPL